MTCVLSQILRSGDLLLIIVIKRFFLLTYVNYLTSTAEEAAILHQPQPAPPQQNVKVEAQALQRFFRVPFAKPANQYRSNEYKKSGWW